MASTSQYVPGVCNINPVEIRRREMIGHVGFGVFVVFVVALVALHAPWYFRTVVFIPAFLACTGYLQARNRFCVGYAGAGQQHADDGEVEMITEDSALKADRAKARMMNAQAFVTAAVVALVFAIIPLN